MDDMDSRMFTALAIGLLALALSLVGVAWLLLAWRQARSGQAMEKALDRRQNPVPAEAGAQDSSGAAHAFGRTLETLAHLGSNWAASRFGKLLMAQEDRDLVDRAGYRRATRARALFLVSRLGLSILFLLAVLVVQPSRDLDSHITHSAVLALAGFGLGWMLPKWMIRRRVAQRQEGVDKELPLLIDLLRLLQGVGLSVDQSLHIIVDEFREVMPILSQELSRSLDLYMRGRSREQSFARLSKQFENEDLAAICRLLCQVDEHGGAVQEPLAHFSERLRDQRKLDLKAEIGKLSVKMTGVMILTLLPALLIITGGAGFIAILRGLSQISS